MPDPLLALSIGIGVMGAAAYVLWPRSGLIARFQQGFLRAKRVLMEDALKHLYDFEYRNLSSTLESIAGALGINGDEAAALVTRLETLGLIVRRQADLGLTAAGRSYALRIVRIHRLWERYLADETNVSEPDWHREAERREHYMTGEETERLSKYLGNPLYDPHGDPIPTSFGTLPGPRGTSLASLEEGRSATVVHVEDEPSSIYAQLVAQNIYPGLLVRTIEKSSKRIVLEAGGNDIVLAPVVAANVSVVPHEQRIREDRLHRTLGDLRPGESARVVGIAPACKGLQRRRLMDLGIVPGTTIVAELESVGGDPVAFRIQEASVALRRQQANFVFVEEISSGGNV
ncbi:MAG: metal-dependent transcriptional regulator [Ignavibacteria bacterium]|nr:metal-dependent transcriptional regulator [Ignavibacteria bacterium]